MSRELPDYANVTPGKIAAACRAAVLRRHIGELVRLLGIEVAPGTDIAGWRYVARNEMRKAFISRSGGLSEEYFEPLIGGAVHEPDPSHKRWFVEPAINAFGRRRVRVALLTLLQTGTDRERAGSALAWYWTGYPLKQQHLRVGAAIAGMGFEADDAPDVVVAWYQAFRGSNEPVRGESTFNSSDPRA